MKIDAATLASAMLNCTMARAQAWAPYIQEAADLFELDSATRLADFIAQIGHESNGLLWVKELWGPEQVPAQATYERDFSKPWGPNLRRGDRNYKAFGLGNAHEGDGFRFRGRGPIQITGRGNYRQVRDTLRAMLGAGAVPDFEVDPAALEAPRWGALSAGNFWRTRHLNDYADRQDFVGETERINGGQNGMADRIARRNRARRALGLS